MRFHHVRVMEVAPHSERTPAGQREDTCPSQIVVAHVAPPCNSGPNPEKALFEGRFHSIIYRYCNNAIIELDYKANNDVSSKHFIHNGVIDDNSLS
jgi:hypothetical protein